MAVTRRDVDKLYNALRPRLGKRKGTTGGGSTTVVIPPHRHSADQIDSIPGVRVAADDVQEAIDELDAEKLAIDGSMAMTGNLDMGGNDINNARDAEVERDLSVGRDQTFIGGFGFANIFGLRNLFMDVASVSEGRIVGPRTIEMAGDSADSEAVITGVERILFNLEPAFSSIEQLSRIEWNTAIEPGVDMTPIDGTLSWDVIEGALRAFNVSGTDVAGTAVGWTTTRAYCNAAILDKFRLVQINQGNGGRPRAQLYAGGIQTPALTHAHNVFGVTMTQATSGQQVQVMRRGIIRLVDDQNGEDWVDGDTLWAMGDGTGTMTNVRPDAPTVLIFVGTVIDADPELDTVSVLVDVRVIPPPSELSNVFSEELSNHDALIYDSGAQFWRTRPIHGSTTEVGSYSASQLDHLIRIDASGGDATVSLPAVNASVGLMLHIKKIDSSPNVVTIDANGVEQIDDEETFDLLLPGESLMIQCDGSSWAILQRPLRVDRVRALVSLRVG